ncbi:MAG TPA: glycoside hydrolase family 16 protein [Saprospiraceae bacterium]|nr:glycoside hydrolase family 16 protein [Saprospiraceae bacterium]
MKRANRQLSLIGLLPLVLILCHCTPQAPKEATSAKAEILGKEGFSLTWQDHFDEFNSEYWTIGLRDTTSGDEVPGAAGRYLLNDRYDAYYTEEDVFIEDGSLVLQNQKRRIQGADPVGTFEYTSGWVMSMHKVSFTEGYLEVRAQFPPGDKVWPAIWLIPEDLTWCPEWDLFEYFGYREGRYDRMGMHFCYAAYPNQQWSDYYIEGFDEQYDADAWHTYGFVWTTDYAAWYIDGQQVRYLSSEGISDWPAKDMYIVLNNGTRTESPDERTQWPNALRVDYIELYTQ